MQVDPPSAARMCSTSPSLADALLTEGATTLMRRDTATDHCVKFSQGLCRIHQEYGAEMLGDACYFYPRIHRAFGESTVVSMAISCPEAARLMLADEQALESVPYMTARMPHHAPNYLPPGISSAAALAIHEQFLAIARDPDIRVEHALMRISAIARGLMHQQPSAWVEALSLYVSLADSRIAAAQPHAADVFNLMHALQGIMRATHRPQQALETRLMRMADQLGMTFLESGAVSLRDDALSRGLALMAKTKAMEEQLQPLLKRYLAAELSQAHFPFAGFGKTLEDRVTVIGVRFATVKYMLAASGELDASGASSIIASLARCLDHLEDPALSMSIYREVGWHLEGRLRALIGDVA